MRKLILFMHSSLDGFATDINGALDWIKVDDEMFDFVGTMTDKADAALYGRATYQIMEDYWPTAGTKPNASKHDIEHSTWYNKVPKYVLSKTLKQTDNPDINIIHENISVEIQKIKDRPGKNIVVFGSPSAGHSLLLLNLIDEFWLFVNPVLLGSGIPVFKNIENKQILQLDETKLFSCGVVGLHYKVVRKE